MLFSIIQLLLLLGTVALATSFTSAFGVHSLRPSSRGGKPPAAKRPQRSVAPPGVAFGIMTKIALWPHNASRIGQSWEMNTTDDTLRLRHSPANLIEAFGAGHVPGHTVVNLWVEGHGQPAGVLSNEKFIFRRDRTDGSYRIVSNYSGLCLGWNRSEFWAPTVLLECATGFPSEGGADATKWRYNNATGQLLASGAAARFALDVGNFDPACTYAENRRYPFCDKSLSPTQRAIDLVKRIPTEAMPGLFTDESAPIEKFKIPHYAWWSEACHGVAKMGGTSAISYGNDIKFVTEFQSPCSSGATFNKSAFREIGKSIGKEGRAMYNVQQAGLTYFAPEINLSPGALWGRAQEAPTTECPYLAGIFAQEWLLGFQNLPKGAPPTATIQASGMVKDLLAGYSLEDWMGFNRFSFNAIISRQDLFDTYLPHMEVGLSPAGGGSTGGMCNYAALCSSSSSSGGTDRPSSCVPACADPQMSTLMRDRWGFDGYIISDSGAVGWVKTEHHYTNSSPKVVELVFKAGMDQELSNQFLPQHIPAALQQGLITRQTLETALVNQFKVLIRAGAFEWPKDVPKYGKYGPKDVRTAYATKLARDTAAEGIVLLKNKDGAALPLDASKLRHVAVMGPFANATDAILGDYHGPASPIISVYEGVKQHVGAAAAATTTLFEGVPVSERNFTGITKACELARSADAVVLAMGIGPTLENEGVDRYTLYLPSTQTAFVNQIASGCAGPRGIPVVVLVVSGAGVDVSSFVNNKFVSAVFWIGYPGEQGGAAAADLIFGAKNPSGRLPHTSYFEEYVLNTAPNDLRVRADPATNFPGRTYRFYTHKVLHPFGFGLLYTKMKLDKVSASPSLQGISGSAIDSASLANKLLLNHVVGTVNVTMGNIGRRDSSYSVLLYVQPLPYGDLVGGQLADFEKVFVPAGATAQVTLKVSATSLAFYNSTHDRRMAKRGAWRWMVMDPPKMLAEGQMHVV